MKSAVWSLRNWWKGIVESKPIQAVGDFFAKTFRVIEKTLYYILWVPAKYIVRYFIWYIYVGIVTSVKYFFKFLFVIPGLYIWNVALKYPVRPIIKFVKSSNTKVHEWINLYKLNIVKIKPFYIDDYGNNYTPGKQAYLWPVYLLYLMLVMVFKVFFFVFWVFSLVYESVSGFIKGTTKLLRNADKFDEIKSSMALNVKELEDGSRHILKGLLYLSPMLILMAIFTFWPIINSFRLIMFEGYVFDPILGDTYDSIGVMNAYDNLVKAIKLDGFLTAGAQERSILFNTILITFLSVTISMVLALLIAVGLTSIKGLRKLFETIYFLPYITNTIALGLVFAYLFSSDGGLVNQLLGWAGVPRNFAWISYGATYGRSIMVLVMYSVWSSLAFKIMVLTSNIQGIDKMYYDAASIDATPKARVFSRITVPLISPMIFYLTITSFIGGFKTYTSVVAIFGDDGGEKAMGYNLKTMVFFVYEQMDLATNPGKMSLAAAAVIVLFVIVMLFTLVQNQISAKRVHY